MATRSDFKQYVYEHRKFSCDLCQKRFKRHKSYMGHLERQHRCLKCDYITCFRHEFDSHFINDHPEIAKNVVKAPSADHATKKFNKKNLLSCNLCDFKTYVSADISKHMFHKHKDEFFFCKYCSYRTTSFDDLGKHESAKHFQGRKYDLLTGFYK